MIKFIRFVKGKGSDTMVTSCFQHDLSSVEQV